MMHLLLVFVLTAPQIQMPAQESPPPIVIRKLFVISANYHSEAKASATIQNVSDRRVASVEIQVDVIDSLRRKVSDRLFIKLFDIGLGDRSIKPGGSKSWEVLIGRYQLPNGCGSYGSASLSDDCLTNVKVNVVKFKEGGAWERDGWRDEPNPAS